MTQIQVTARLKIHERQLEQFKAVARDCLASVLENDQGTLQYDWFFSDDASECVVRERYADSDAVLDHMANLGETLHSLLAISDLSLEVFGKPSEAGCGPPLRRTQTDYQVESHGRRDDDV